jgi:hypothetical protein
LAVAWAHELGLGLLGLVSVELSGVLLVDGLVELLVDALAEVLRVEEL